MDKPIKVGSKVKIYGKDGTYKVIELGPKGFVILEDKDRVLFSSVKHLILIK